VHEEHAAHGLIGISVAVVHMGLPPPEVDSASARIKRETETFAALHERDSRRHEHSRAARLATLAILDTIFKYISIADDEKTRVRFSRVRASGAICPAEDPPYGILT